MNRDELHERTVAVLTRLNPRYDWCIDEHGRPVGYQQPGTTEEHFRAHHQLLRFATHDHLYAYDLSIPAKDGKSTAEVLKPITLPQLEKMKIYEECIDNLSRSESINKPLADPERAMKVLHEILGLELNVHPDGFIEAALQTEKIGILSDKVVRALMMSDLIHIRATDSKDKLGIEIPTLEATEKMEEMMKSVNEKRATQVLTRLLKGYEWSINADGCPVGKELGTNNLQESHERHAAVMALSDKKLIHYDYLQTHEDNTQSVVLKPLTAAEIDALMLYEMKLPKTEVRGGSTPGKLSPGAGPSALIV